MLDGFATDALYPPSRASEASVPITATEPISIASGRKPPRFCSSTTDDRARLPRAHDVLHSSAQYDALSALTNGCVEQPKLELRA
jgi:hypothetical protein